MGIASAPTGGAAAVAFGSPLTEASVACSQLPSGITCETSRISRSQSKRVWATPATEASRCWATSAKLV